MVDPNSDVLHKKNFINVAQKPGMIERLHDLHLLLYKLSNEISDFYALPMLFCLSHLFISLLTYSYYFIRPIVFGFPTLPFLLYIHSFIRLIHLAVLFLILTKSVTSVIVEVKV